MNSQEINTCSFCRADKPVMRQYLHAKNKPTVGDGFDFIYYCNECGIMEEVINPSHVAHVESPMTTLNTIIEEEKKLFDQLYTPMNSGNPNAMRHHEHLKQFLATAMQRAYEAGKKEERDRILAIVKAEHSVSYGEAAVAQEIIIDRIERLFDGEKELDHCTTCNQMTNHRGGVCLKCKE